MKKNKILILLIVQLFIISMIFLSNYPNKLNNWSLTNNKALNSTLSSNQIPNMALDSNGTAICNLEEMQYMHKICSDGNGGAIIAWVDRYDFGYSQEDIYAQKISFDGITEWNDNGTAVCYLSEDQNEVQLCSDNNGGAIITWVGYGADTNIYAQRINSTGQYNWTLGGVDICTALDDQYGPHICSDDEGGAIIAWMDHRGVSWDIYAQRVNSSGDLEWAFNGVIICNAIDIQGPLEICSDGAGGAIITWRDRRNIDYDIYAQRVDSNGTTLWNENGTVICNSTGDQNSPQICSDGASGAIITWYDERDGVNNDDIYAQHINSSGYVGWNNNGMAICIEDNIQSDPKICSDNAGSAIIAWVDIRNGIDKNIYAQKINSIGIVEWDANGTIICNASGHQVTAVICSDGAAGAIIAWNDQRSGSKIYAQWINSSSDIKWDINGIAICPKTNDQSEPQICSDGAGGAFVAWSDSRHFGTGPDIYAQHITNITNLKPYSNHPNNITTTRTGIETIDWILYDEYKTGQYRVWVNDTNDNYYTWVDWTSWDNGTSLSVPINRTSPGIYNYTIEFDDSYLYGDSDTVIITVMDKLPATNQPGDIMTTTSSSDAIFWKLYDDWGEEKYRVWVNDTNDDYTVWIDWDTWVNNTFIMVPINRSITGIFNYTIEFNSTTGQTATDTVIVTITSWPPQDYAPTSNHPQNIGCSIGASETIDWILYDDIGSSYYRVWVNDTNDNYYILEDWTTWTDGVQLSIPINSTELGTFNYTIEYNDSINQFGVPDIVYVIISDSLPTCNQPGDVSTTLNGVESIQWILYDIIGSGQYRIWVNGSVYHDWTTWTNNTPIDVAIIRNKIGIFNYTIEFNSSTGQYATDTVYVVITSTSQPSEEPIFITGGQGGGDFLSFLLSPLGLGIIGAIIAINVVISLFIARKYGKVQDVKPVSKKFEGKKVKKID